MCSGRIDLEFVFRAFSKGMDGVFIGGCRLNECNYITHGNYHALNMVLLCKKIMSRIGLNPDRLTIDFMSSGEGNHFAEAVNDFSRTVASLGPLGSSEGLDREESNFKLKEVRKLIPYVKIAMREKLDARIEKEDEYEGFYTTGEIDRLFDEIVSCHIDPDKCQACMICRRRCPVQAISGDKGLVHVIDQEKCIKCGTCLKACPPRFGAVREISGE
jgi:coenzyme F420-reducing hydrogenase delta subunit/ferredoxin